MIELVVVLGVSGAGKTTACNILAQHGCVSYHPLGTTKRALEKCLSLPHGSLDLPQGKNFPLGLKEFYGFVAHYPRFLLDRYQTNSLCDYIPHPHKNSSFRVGDLYTEIEEWLKEGLGNVKPRTAQNLMVRMYHAYKILDPLFTTRAIPREIKELADQIKSPQKTIAIQSVRNMHEAMAIWDMLANEEVMSITTVELLRPQAKRETSDEQYEEIRGLFQDCSNTFFTVKNNGDLEDLENALSFCHP